MNLSKKLKIFFLFVFSAINHILIAEMPEVIKNSGISFHSEDSEFSIQKDSNLNHTDTAVNVRTVEINEVIVEDYRQDAINKVFTGGKYISTEEVRNIPAFMGEKDVVRAIKLQTGIQSVSEGNSGVYVRGGNSGQNLFLFDDMELLNPSHMMGLYSVFNPLTTSDVFVYKGNAPVTLNSRLSSAICINSGLAENGKNEFEFSLGNISSTLALKLVDKSRKWFLTTGFRRSYLEALGLAASWFLPDRKNYFKQYGYKFYDFNGKILGKISERSSVMAAWYTGADLFNADIEEMNMAAGTNAGNVSAVLQYKYSPDEFNTFKHTLGYTYARSGFSGDIIQITCDMKSYFKQYYLKNLWAAIKNDHYIESGVDLFMQMTNPIDMKALYMSDAFVQFEKFNNTSAVFHIGDTWTPSGRNFSVYAGMKGTLFSALGPYEYLDQVVGENEIAKVWFNFSPVISVSYQPEKGQNIKGSFSVNDQNLHLATFSSIPLPNDLWMPSTPGIKPEVSEQLTIGYYRENKDFDFSVETWTKYMDNQLILNFVTDYSVFNGFEDEFLKGVGFAYGLEFSVKKKTGKLRGNLNYTYSRSKRSFEKILNGAWFNDKYDRPHDFNINASYDLNKRWKFSGVWVLASGMNLSLPTGRWWMMGSVMNDYDGFNRMRLPVYHRLDLSASLKLKSKIFRESELNFSVLNVYNRANPYYIYYRVLVGDSQYSLDIKPVQVSLFPIMPSVSWRVKL